jgi:hypothetical protein
MITADFYKIYFEKLNSLDDLKTFICDNDDNIGCNDFIHKNRAIFCVHHTAKPSDKPNIHPKRHR